MAWAVKVLPDNRMTDLGPWNLCGIERQPSPVSCPVTSTGTPWHAPILQNDKKSLKMVHHRYPNLQIPKSSKYTGVLFACSLMQPALYTL